MDKKLKQLYQKKGELSLVLDFIDYAEFGEKEFKDLCQKFYEELIEKKSEYIQSYNDNEKEIRMMESPLYEALNGEEE
jgi:hypothetical protein